MTSIGTIDWIHAPKHNYVEYSIEKKPKSQIAITITTTKEETNTYLEDAVKRLGSKMKIDGFRKGKIPADVVRAKSGDSAIFSEALEHALPRLYAEVIKKEDLKPVSQPQAEILNDNPLKAKLVVDVLPEVKLGDYLKIAIHCVPEKVTKKAQDEALDQMRESFAEYVEVTRGAKEGDRVEINFEGFDDKKQPIAGAKSEHHPLILGSKTFIPGFEEKLEGVKATEDHEFDIRFPKDYHAEELQDAKVHFVVKIHSVEEKKLPELNNEFVKKVTGHKISTVDDLKKDVEIALSKQAVDKARQESEEKVVDKLIDMTTAEIPESMTEDEVEYLKQDFVERIKGQGMTLESFMESQKLDEKELLKNFVTPAKRRIMTRLALNEIAAREKIEPTEKEVAKALSSVEEEKRSRMKDSVWIQVRMQKTLDFLFSQTIEVKDKSEKMTASKPKKGSSKKKSTHSK